MLHPTQQLIELKPGITLNASKLRMSTTRIKGHFFTSPLPEQVLITIRAKMKADLQRMGSKIHTPRILRAGAEILTHMQRLSSGRPVNEADMLCESINVISL